VPKKSEHRGGSNGEEKHVKHGERVERVDSRESCKKESYGLVFRKGELSVSLVDIADDESAQYEEQINHKIRVTKNVRRELNWQLVEWAEFLVVRNDQECRYTAQPRVGPDLALCRGHAYARAQLALNSGVNSDRQAI